MAEAAQGREGQERPEGIARGPARQSEEQRHDRRADQEEGGRGRHEQQVLHHVRAEQEAREGIERRGGRDPERGEPGQERGQPPGLQMRAPQRRRAPPPAHVDGAHEDERGQQRLASGTRIAAPLPAGRGPRPPQRDDEVAGEAPAATGRAGSVESRAGAWPLGAQRLEEGDQGRGLGRAQAVAVGGHVAAPLQDLADELIAGEAHGDVVESGPAPAAFVAERVAVAALLVLQHERALQLERAAALQLCGPAPEPSSRRS